MANGTKQDPWILTTPPGSSEYTMYRDDASNPPALVCQVGSTTLTYQLRAVEDLHAWLAEQGDWVPLGAADEKKSVAEGTVEAWGGRRTIRYADGTAFATAIGDASGCIFRHSSKSSGSQKSPTKQETTRCAPSKPVVSSTGAERQVRGLLTSRPQIHTEAKPRTHATDGQRASATFVAR